MCPADTSSDSKVSSHLWPHLSYRCVFVEVKQHNMYLWRRSENSHGLGWDPAARRSHEPLCVVTAAAVRHFLDVLHVLWKNPSLFASNVKSTGLYQYTKECE